MGNLSFFKKRPEVIVSPVLLLIIILLIEYIIIPVFNIPSWIIPPPFIVFKTLFSSFKRQILSHFIVTLLELFSGYGMAILLGIALAAFITQFRFLEQVLTPYIILMVTMPIVSLIPLLLIWLGVGMITKIVAVTIAAFPPIMMNAITGFRSTESLKLDLMRSLSATKVQTFIKVRFPNALPNIFTGLLLGGITSLITCIAAEFLGGSVGLGYLVVVYSSILNVKGLFAVIIIISLLGIGFYELIVGVQHLVIRWPR
ncbi:Riboflavin transport system permease protein RibX [subsurface metagenome]